MLTRELAAYWSVLEPTFGWTAEQRQKAGYAFLRDEVFPRRTSMLAIADQIRRFNEAQLTSGKVAVQLSYQQFRSRLLITIGLTIALGLVLAIFSTRKILELEDTSDRHYQEISHARVELKQLSARLLEAQEEERRLISRELHDEVGQALTGVLVEMANLSNLIATKRNPLCQRKPMRSNGCSKSRLASSAIWPCCSALPCSTISAWFPLCSGRLAKFPSGTGYG